MLLTLKQLPTGAIFMWTAPRPAWNQTVSGTANIKTVVIQVLNGSTNFPVRWNYSLLPDQSIEFTYFSIRYGNNPPDGIGAVVKGRPAQIYGAKNFKTRFTIDSTSEFSTLTINKVTERENATFQCKISADQEWAYDVRIKVAGVGTMCLKKGAMSLVFLCLKILVKDVRSKILYKTDFFIP